MSSTRERPTEVSRPALRDGSPLRERAYVDGAWIEGVCGETFPVVDPATGERCVSANRIGKVRLRILRQENRILIPAPFSPVR